MENVLTSPLPAMRFSKASVWTGRALSGLAVAFLLFDGAIKLVPIAAVIDSCRQLGYPTEIARHLGLMPKPADAPLRVLMLHKADRVSEAGQPLSSKQKADLTRLKSEMTKAGVLISSETLQPSSRGKRSRTTS
jgi:hypothetical protein